MARRRYLTTDISLDERVNDLAVQYGDFAALLYTWMIPHAEDDGIIYASARRLLYMVVPMRRDINEGDIELALSGMDEFGLIEWMPEISQIAFPPETFYRYQTYVKPEKRRESPKCDTTETADSASDQPTDEQRTTPQNTEKQRPTPTNIDERRTTPQKAASVSPSVSPSVSTPTVVENDRASPGLVETQPWTVVEDVFEVTGADATDLGRAERGRQSKTAQSLLADHDRDAIQACARWLWSQDFWRSRGIDVMTVRDQIPRWIAAGRPQEFQTAQQPPPQTVHLGPAYREFDPSEIP